MQLLIGQNNKIANNTTTTEAQGKINADLGSLEV
jgi:hypothetical protein